MTCPPQLNAFPSRSRPVTGGACQVRLGPGWGGTGPLESAALCTLSCLQTLHLPKPRDLQTNTLWHFHGHFRVARAMEIGVWPSCLSPFYRHEAISANRQPWFLHFCVFGWSLRCLNCFNAVFGGASGGCVLRFTRTGCLALTRVKPQGFKQISVSFDYKTAQMIKLSPSFQRRQNTVLAGCSWVRPSPGGIRHPLLIYKQTSPAPTTGTCAVDTSSVTQDTLVAAPLS